MKQKYTAENLQMQEQPDVNTDLMKNNFFFFFLFQGVCLGQRGAGRKGEEEDEGLL